MNRIYKFPIWDFLLMISLIGLLPLGTIWIGEQWYLPIILKSGNQSPEHIFIWGGLFGVLGSALMGILVEKPIIQKAIIRVETYFETINYPIRSKDKSKE